jgi:hypothetical protein
MDSKYTRTLDRPVLADMGLIEWKKGHKFVSSKADKDGVWEKTKDGHNIKHLSENVKKHK